MRDEQTIFDEIAMLCARPGYAHAIAYLCFRDNFIAYSGELKPNDYAKMYGNDRLIRTEISTLIGLMLRAPLDLSLPTQEKIARSVTETETLLKELHDAMGQPMRAALQTLAKDPTRTTPDPFRTAEGMREPIFYGAESAYSFQYRDFSTRKYHQDARWLKNNKGFTAGEAAAVTSAIGAILDDNTLAALKDFRDAPSEDWSILKGFEFCSDEVAKRTKLPLEIVTQVINAFTCPDNGNPTFTSLNEFNASNAYPIIRGASDRYILFQYVSLTEAIYDTPFYWMVADKSYESTAMQHRGQFTEGFTADRLKHVFAMARVHSNVVLWKTRARKERLGEIDVLALFGDRAIVVQAKSKKLTLVARRGNDLQLQKDFKGAVQDACDQGALCSRLLLSGSAILIDSHGNEISLPEHITQIQPICVVSDHYPALAFQAQQFLKIAATDRIAFPLVCDIFFIDVVSEFLDTPLRFLSYLELRAKAADSVARANGARLSFETESLVGRVRQDLP